jgi:acyl-CoA synthetase (AMP-forming)/AMP-acid ligase II
MIDMSPLSRYLGCHSSLSSYNCPGHVFLLHQSLFSSYIPRMPRTAQSPYGRRLVVDIVDDVASKDPSRPWLYQPCTSSPKDGWEPITFGQLANAVNYVARIINVNITSKSSTPFPTVSYIGASDARYGIVLLACIKAGAQAFFISPRNSLEGQLSLLNSTDCNHLWHSESFTTQAELYAKHRPMKTTLVPSLNEWLQSKAAPFPYERSFDEAEWDPLVVLHSSGSTGIPKPIVIRQGSIAVFEVYRGLPDFFLMECAKRAKRILVSFPLFHAAGTMIVLIGISIFFGVPCALTPSDRPIEAGLVRECLAHAEVDAALLPPSILEDLALDEDGMAKLKKLNLVMFGGGMPAYL